jgi:hypothetical protein
MSNIRIYLGRSHHAGLIQKLRGDPSGVYYSKLSTILTECSWGDPGRLNRVLTCQNLPRNIPLIFCLVYYSILRWDLPGVFE